MTPSRSQRAHQLQRALSSSDSTSIGLFSSSPATSCGHFLFIHLVFPTRLTSSSLIHSMTTLARNPLASAKPLANHFSATVTPWHTTSRRQSSSTKRAHSPEPTEGHGQSIKRVRAAPDSVRATPQEQKRRDGKDARPETKEERDRQRALRESEFRDKYTRAFPGWTFYFDLDAHQPELAALRSKLERRVTQLGAVRKLWHLSLASTHQVVENRGLLLQRDHSPYYVWCGGSPREQRKLAISRCARERYSWKPNQAQITVGFTCTSF